MNVTGAAPSTVAATVLGPAAGPRVQLRAEAMPAASVATLVSPSWPRPEVTAKVTVAPTTGFPWRSTTFTAGAVVTGLDRGAVCESGATRTSAAPRSARAVARKVAK